ncbi:MAG TPA: hypothetical protein VNJ07_02460 [Chitinophagales bacterium]|nr:hypothetical protein [Chitinophagales bacterium]
MLNGKLPVFDERTPGYSLFLFSCKAAGLNINQIFIAQCIISWLVIIYCQFLISRYTPRYRWIFFLLGIIFYSSAHYINYNTRINPISLFTDFSILTCVLLIVSAITRKPRHLLLAAFTCWLLILLRPQGFYVLPALALVVAGLSVKREFKKAASLVVPLAMLLLLLFAYNKATFGNFLFGQYGSRQALGAAVFYLDDTGAYSPEIKAVIQKINDSFTDEEREILRGSWSYQELSKVFNVTNWDKVWEFHRLFKTHSDELRQLGKNSMKQHPDFYLKFIYTNFIYCFLLNRDDYFFYYNELVNRKFYIEQSNEFTFMELPEEDYRHTFGEYTDIIRKKSKLTKTGIIRDDDYTSDFGSEKFLVKLNHYYQIVFAELFSNSLWLWLAALSAGISAVLVIRSRLKHDELLLLQIPLLLVIFNNILISLSIPPLDGYVFPTRFFLYFYPLSILYYCLSEYVFFQASS